MFTYSAPTRAIPALAALLVAAATSPALADRLRVPTDFDTIQIAATNATPGDTILVLRGTHTDPVTLTGLQELTIRGSRGATVRVSGGPAFVLDGCSMMTIEKLTIEAPDDDAVQLVDGTANEVARCTFRNVLGTAVLLRGETRCSVVRNRMDDVGTEAVEIVSGTGPSSGCLVDRNRIRTTGSTAIVAQGNEIDVLRNRVDDALFGGIDTFGFNTEVSRNRVARSGAEGIRVRGDGAFVWNNRVLDAGADGLVLETGNRSDLFRNTVVNPTGVGIVVGSNTDDILVERNAVKGGTTGLQESGNGNEVMRNRFLRPTGDGITSDAPDTEFTGNRVIKPGRHGAVIQGAMSIWDRNSITLPGGDGFQVFSTGNTFRRNSVRRPGDEGLRAFNAEAAHTFDRNRFGSELYDQIDI